MAVAVTVVAATMTTVAVAGQTLFSSSQIASTRSTSSSSNSFPTKEQFSTVVTLTLLVVDAATKAVVRYEGGDKNVDLQRVLLLCGNEKDSPSAPRLDESRITGGTLLTFFLRCNQNCFKQAAAVNSFLEVPTKAGKPSPSSLLSLTIEALTCRRRKFQLAVIVGVGGSGSRRLLLHRKVCTVEKKKKQSKKEEESSNFAEEEVGPSFAIAALSPAQSLPETELHLLVLFRHLDSSKSFWNSLEVKLFLKGWQFPLTRPQLLLPTALKVTLPPKLASLVSPNFTVALVDRATGATAHCPAPFQFLKKKNNSRRSSSFLPIFIIIIIIRNFRGRGVSAESFQSTTAKKECLDGGRPIFSLF
ncbi:Transcription factor COE2 [Tyrophagus putrescentiae]|nr:Transcription factor COE2 [Tyrophagus putrescentiae]